MTLEITPAAFNIQPYCNFLSLEIFWSGFRLELFSLDLCVAFFSFKVHIYIFSSGKAFQHIYYGVDDKYLVVKLLPRQKLESFCCPSLHWQCRDYQQAFQSGHLSQTGTTMGILFTARAEGQFIPLITFTSFSYVYLSFLRLRWRDETSSHVLLVLTTVFTIVFSY